MHPSTTSETAAPFWRWSISEAWDWLVGAWTALIHVPYLGILALVVVLVLFLRLLSKLMR